MLLVCMDGVLRQLVLFSSKPLLILKQCKMFISNCNKIWPTNKTLNGSLKHFTVLVLKTLRVKQNF
jgi:hypothetical protein